MIPRLLPGTAAPSSFAHSLGRSWLAASLLAFFLAGVLPSCGGGEGDEAATAEVERDVDPMLVGDILEAPEELDPLPSGSVPPEARPDQVEALDRANWYRWQSNLPPLDMIDAINKACQAHCDYYVKHKDKYQGTGTSPHDENPQWADGFTGVAPWDRMGHFGYGDGAAEVIAFLHNPTGAVDGWMNTLYHRIPFMDATMMSCGYGAAGSGTWQDSSKIDTMDFGFSDADGKKYMGPERMGIYPPPDSSGIPPSFDGMETPQPPPPPGGYPSGTIISITWSSPGGFKVIEHRLWAEKDGDDIPHVWVDPSNDSNLAGGSTIAMYAHDPLEQGTKYWVSIKGERGGKAWEKTWSFHTARY